jgi:hypothetical protein
MFGISIQTQFSVFEYRKWWARIKIFLFGYRFHFLHSNIITVQLILNSLKMRTTFCCFHLNSTRTRLLFKRSVAFLQIFARMTGGIIVIKPIFFFLFLTLSTTTLSFCLTIAAPPPPHTPPSHSCWLGLSSPMATWHHRPLHPLPFVLQWFLFSPTVISLSLSSFSSLSRRTICA